MIRRLPALTVAALLALSAGTALAQTTVEPPPLVGWDKIHFGMTSKALTDAYPGAQWSEEPVGQSGDMKRTFRTDVEGAPYDVVVQIVRDRVARLTLTKVLKPGLDEAACKAAFTPDDARLRKQYGAPTETSVRGDRWLLGAGSRLLLVVVRLAPDDGTPPQCLVTTGFYPPGSPPAPAG